MFTTSKPELWVKQNGCWECSCQKWAFYRFSNVSLEWKEHKVLSGIGGHLQGNLETFQKSIWFIKTNLKPFWKTSSKKGDFSRPMLLWLWIHAPSIFIDLAAFLLLCMCALRNHYYFLHQFYAPLGASHQLLALYAIKKPTKCSAAAGGAILSVLYLPTTPLCSYLSHTHTNTPSNMHINRRTHIHTHKSTHCHTPCNRYSTCMQTHIVTYLHTYNTHAFTQAHADIYTHTHTQRTYTKPQSWCTDMARLTRC